MAMEKTHSSSLLGTDFTDDYILLPPQEGGGHHEPSPSIMITPTQLCQKIKATTQNTGLIHEASFRRSFVPSTETSADVLQSSDGDNPFLSEPLIKAVSNTHGNTSITKNIEGDNTPWSSQLKPHMIVSSLNTLTIKAASNAHTDTSIGKHTGEFVEISSLLKPSTMVIPFNTLLQGSSKPPPEQSAPSPHIPVKSAHGLAPLSALNKLGFEPAQSVNEPIHSRL
ncbi:hypothetical protein SCLCIDRAFT_34584 [Scleroderma citrinum Foug A]|uniref:Uncharacterized protein n=1 Tax=Scleroderma citrinum Foug A TaxID=1036808 RepID=A0A0C3D194_9AGAM|nr:hypothetical protein SCLCIDRAFT_34584 [Scleroderma citrinum Foug A]